MSERPKGLSALNRSIRMQLVVGTVVILIAVVLALTTLIARSATRLLEDQTSIQLEQLSTQSVRALTDFLDARTATVDLWGTDTLLLSVVRDPGLAAVFMPGLRRYLTRYADREPWIGNVFITRGAELVFSLYPDQPGMPDFALFDGDDDATTTLIAAGDGHPPYLVIRRQARDRGQRMEGVYVSLLLDLSVVQQRLLSNVGMGANGFAALLGPEGQALLDTPVALDLELGRELVPGPHIQGSASYLIQIRAVPETPLNVAWAAARVDIEAPVRSLALAVVLLGGTAILIGLAGMIFFTGRVTAPIRRLTQDARREAMLRFGDHMIDPNTAKLLDPAMSVGGESRKLVGYGPDEIGELATVFELLGRTSDELTETNAQLEARNSDLSYARTRLRENLDRLERELNSARTLQLSMVPQPDAGISLGTNVSVHALMEPAREVGGDFYDFFTVDDDTLCLLIGDVSDKGTPSALFMARTISLVRFSTTQIARLSGQVPRPADVLSEVNAELCKANATRMFVTLFMAIVDRRTGQVAYSNAGHPSPVMCKRGAAGPLSEDHPDLPLGVRQGFAYKDHRFAMQSGDQLVLFTDGVTEAENNANAFYGLDRLMACVADRSHASAQDLISKVHDDITAFTDGAEQFDDITMLVFGWKAQ